MVKSLFNGKAQIFTNETPSFFIELNNYYEPDVYMNCISLGKIVFCWKLPKEGKDYHKTKEE